MRAAGGGGRPRPAEGSKRKEARLCGPLSQNRSDNTSCPVGAYSSYHFPQRLSSGRPHHTGGPPRGRPGTVLPGHRATGFPPPSGRRCSSRRKLHHNRKVGPAWPHLARPSRAIPGKHLLTLALPEMTPGRPQGAGHPLYALGWPRWGQPPAVCSVCLPRLRGPEITGPLRCGGRRVPHRATLRKGLDPARPRAGGRGAGAPLRRLSRCGYLAPRLRTAPRSGARVGTPLAAPRAARHRWAGANCRMTGLRQFAPACLECPLLYAGTFGLRPRAGVGHFDGPRIFWYIFRQAPHRARRAGAAGRALRCPAPAPLAIPGTSVAYRRGRRQRPRQVLRSH